MRKVTLLGFVVFSLFSCEQPNEVVKFENIVRVFMHGTCRYTLFVESKTAGEVEQYTVLATPKIFTDVPGDQKNWARYEKVSRGCFNDYINFEIHIHNVQEIDGGG